MSAEAADSSYGRWPSTRANCTACSLSGRGFEACHVPPKLHPSMDLAKPLPANMAFCARCCGAREIGHACYRPEAIEIPPEDWPCQCGHRAGVHVAHSEPSNLDRFDCSEHLCPCFKFVRDAEARSP